MNLGYQYTSGHMPAADHPAKTRARHVKQTILSLAPQALAGDAMIPLSDSALRYMLRRVKAAAMQDHESLLRLTRIAAKTLDVPAAAISLADSENQWFVTAIGLPMAGLPRDGAPCDETAEVLGPVFHSDLLAHSSYHQSPLAQAGIRFYAGVPLITEDGLPIGALNVFAPEPRNASPRELALLTDLAEAVMAQIKQTLAQIHIDPVSGLPNRNRFDEELADLAERHPGMPLIAVLIDLGSPEQVSTILRVMGPTALDQLITALGQFVRTTVDPADGVFHVSATQFATLAPLGAQVDDHLATVRKLIQIEATRLQQQFGGGVVLGIAPFILGETEPKNVLRMANSAVQDARLHHETVRLYSERHDEAYRRRFELVQSFERALKQPGELWLSFQPRIDLKHGVCHMAEALLRWDHPRLGAVSPAEFIPLIEPTAMIHGLTDWVVVQALDAVTAWRAHQPNFVVSINVSPHNLADESFAQRLLQRLGERGLPPAAIELEVTEATFIRNDATVMHTLNRLSEAGIALAIDDFGTGYSSLSYLQALPARTVKLDRSFMQGLETDQRKHALVGTTTMLCQTLGYRVVAEGLETLESVTAVAGIGCDEGQGFHFARPMPAAALSDWLARPFTLPAEYA